MRSSWLSHESRSISGSVSKNGADTKGAKRKTKLHTYLQLWTVHSAVMGLNNLRQLNADVKWNIKVFWRFQASVESQEILDTLKK